MSLWTYRGDPHSVYNVWMSGRQLVLEARRRAGLTQRQLADAAGVSQATIARIESGVTDPSFGQVQRLLDRCGLELRASLVPLDDSEWSVARSNLRLDPSSRVRQHQGVIRFVEAAREAKRAGA